MKRDWPMIVYWLLILVGVVVGLMAGRWERGMPFPDYRAPNLTTRSTNI